MPRDVVCSKSYQQGRVKTLRGERCVLIVDDEPLVSEVLSSILHTLGYSSLIASDGLSALKLFEEHKEDTCCVILDFKLPGLHPGRALTCLRQIKPDVKVLLSSGYPKEQVLADESLNEIDSFLSKPYDLSELNRLLSKALDEA